MANKGEGSGTVKSDMKPADLAPGLRRIRQRRRVLWGVILAYLPAMAITLKSTPSLYAAGVVFAVWFILLFSAAMVTAVVKCPRCGNAFHLHGMTYLPLRKCLHCQLPVNADRRG